MLSRSSHLSKLTPKNINIKLTRPTLLSYINIVTPKESGYYRHELLKLVENGAARIRINIFKAYPFTAEALQKMIS